jgi:lipase maturation factor 1
MVPLLSFNRFGKVPRVAIYANWWLIFRIMIGSGLIKIRGDQCWRDLTCMDYHYETQPVPNPLSFYLHHNYSSFHKLETIVNHIVELITPWFTFLSRDLRIMNGMFQIIFQLILISSGNLSFLNWLTILPSLCFLDDQFLTKWFPMFYNSEMRKKYGDHDATSTSSKTTFSLVEWLGYLIGFIKDAGFALLVLYLSVPVVRNLLALDGHQHMNTSFDTFKIVNTYVHLYTQTLNNLYVCLSSNSSSLSHSRYGAFGSITKVRTEVIFKGTNDDIMSIRDKSKIVWKEYEFKCKPGDVNRRPCLISPYHYRLDWLLWFAAFGDYNQHPWILHLTWNLLKGRNEAKDVYDLIQFDPFYNQTKAPKFIKADHYEYKFAPWNHKDKKAWWVRKYLKEYFPPLSLDNKSLKKFLGKS